MSSIKKDGCPPAPRPTKEEYNERIDIVQTHLLDGESRTEIREFCKQRWNIEHSAADNLIEKAQEALSQFSADDRQRMQGEIIRRLKHLYRKAILADDLRTAFRIQVELCNIAQLKKDQPAPPQKVIYLDKVYTPNVYILSTF